MPRVHPHQAESYLCTPIRWPSPSSSSPSSPIIHVIVVIIRRTRVTFIVTKWQNVKYFRVDTDVTYSITGFRPNATKMTAHHMLIYGEQEQWKVGKEGQQIKMLVFSIQVVRSRELRPQLGIAERWPSRSRASARHSLVQRWGPWWWWLSELPSSMLP